MTHASTQEPKGRYLYGLMLAALGVVYGDIGTSPLYAIRECFHGPHSVPPSHDNILGVLSLIFWSLTSLICVKYLVYILRADNNGEGGILAMMALVYRSKTNPARERWLLVMIGLFGAALLYGDGIITPAISVLSAVEGLEFASPVFNKYVIHITIAILIALFAVQKSGTAKVGTVFGPVMLVWFTVLAVTGAINFIKHPSVLAALNPWYGGLFFVHNGWHGFLVLGSVFLVVTGGEALYADMGHFGKTPIRIVWFGLVLPALLLNYFGQGALLLEDPAHAVNPFYHMIPGWAQLPMVFLATAATIIASQAVISGAFSLTRQAVQLGYFPRVNILHTSADEIGQIYVPGINWGLMIACIWLVVEFKTSSNLAAAYGVAVSTAMLITTIIFYFIARERFGWKTLPAALFVGVFLIIGLAFFGATIVKIWDGGWVPLVVAAAIFTIMTTWKTGRRILAERQQESQFPVELFLKEMEKNAPHRVPGTAVFMYRNKAGIPPALLHNVKHNKIIHDKVVFLTIENLEIPHVRGARTTVENLGNGFFRILIRYGFRETPNVPAELSRLKLDDLEFKPMETTYFLGRETLIATKRPGMAQWRERLFARMSRNERTATSFFQLPPNRVVELGEQIEL